jgi:transglutaminase-like putative cysteine protease
MLSEAIDSLGSIPDLDINFNKRQTEPNITQLPQTVRFGEKCDLDNFMNQSEGAPDLRITGVPKTSYLRATIFEKFSQGQWTTPESQRSPYSGIHLPTWVDTYLTRESLRITISPLVKIVGYVPTVLNLKKLDSTAQLSYNQDLLIFHTSTPLSSSYNLSYRVYRYDENMLKTAQLSQDSVNLQIPEEDVDWLREIAEEITQNSSSLYEKILSLISYLKENYIYNLEFEPAPPGVNPIEWFLKGNNEGVCTHFNSALVLLARSIGIPSRLAGGYLIDPMAETQLVYPSQRHAFAEIPFENLGWIIFDATPAVGCSVCESAEGEEDASQGDQGPIRPTDSVYNGSTPTDGIDTSTKISPESVRATGQDIEVFEIYGIPGTRNLRIMVGEYYDGLWDIIQPEPIEYTGELLSHQITGTRSSHYFTITPKVEMGGFIPTAKYTDTLSLDQNSKFYTDQLVFFSSEILREPYVVTTSYYEFSQETKRNADPTTDQRYLNVPENLNSIFRELALQATEGAATPYDKYKALVTFLRTTFEYNDNYTRAPSGIDPVEWFLFHEKKGVCINFNSAFVLLARSVGLPARLVRGYAIEADSNFQVVNASQTHIYSEAPFEGLGWISFDVTGSKCPHVSSSNGDTEEDGEDGKGELGIEPIDEVCTATDSKSCILPNTKCSAEGGLPEKVDLFYIYGITGTSYLRTGVGEKYEGVWEMVAPSPEPFHGELLEYPITHYTEATKYRFMIAPIVEMGGFIPSAQYSNELIIDYPTQLYPDQQLFFSSSSFTSSYIISHTEYEFTTQTLLEASLMEDPKYLNVPPNLVTQLRSLALNVTNGVGLQYLKIVALRDYLKTTYEYDTNYTKAPPGIDPVEWFLFHEKRGACANFNSAFVLLARSIGLPARYVVGYAIKPNVETQKITSIQGHGYAEFPFSDLGWIIFDATGPGFLPFEEEPEIPPILETTTEITEQDSLGVKGLEIRVVGSVVDENGDPMDGLQTLIYLKETKEENGLLCGEGAVVDGWFNVSCTLPMYLTNGYYLVQAHTLGNQFYNGSWSDPPLKVVTKSEVTLYAPDKVITGRPFTFQGNLTEFLTGEPIENKMCMFQSEEDSRFFETDVNGFFSEVYILDEPGEQRLMVLWLGEEFYLNTSASSIIRSVPLTITPDEIAMMVRQEEIVIQGRVHAEELLGDDETVGLVLDDNEIGTAKTDENGIFTFSYIIPRTQELGEVLIEYSLRSNSYSINQTSIVYARTNLQLVAPNSIDLTINFTLNAALTDDLGNPISGVNMTVENKEENWNTTLLTDDNGELEILLKIDKALESNQLLYQASFNGISYYLESSDETVVSLELPLKREFDVLELVTGLLIIVATSLLLYTTYKFLEKRRKSAEDKQEDTEKPKELIPQELSTGIRQLDERFKIEFPQIAASFPVVWGVEEEFIILLGLVKGIETFGGILAVQLIIDSEAGATIALSSEGTVEHSHVFKEKGFHNLQLVFDEEGPPKIAVDTVIKIVDYREEVNDLFNNEFEEYRNLREEIKNHFTAREFMHSVLESVEASERYYQPLNEMVSIFEIADYSLHDVKRGEYERFLHAKQDFEEIEVGV